MKNFIAVFLSYNTFLSFYHLDYDSFSFSLSRTSTLSLFLSITLQLFFLLSQLKYFATLAHLSVFLKTFLCLFPSLYLSIWLSVLSLFHASLPLLSLTQSFVLIISSFVFLGWIFLNDLQVDKSFDFLVCFQQNTTDWNIRNNDQVLKWFSCFESLLEILKHEILLCKKPGYYVVEKRH